MVRRHQRDGGKFYNSHSRRCTAATAISGSDRTNNSSSSVRRDTSKTMNNTCHESLSVANSLRAKLGKKNTRRKASVYRQGNPSTQILATSPGIDSYNSDSTAAFVDDGRERDAEICQLNQRQDQDGKDEGLGWKEGMHEDRGSTIENSLNGVNTSVTQSAVLKGNIDASVSISISATRPLQAFLAGPACCISDNIGHSSGSGGGNDGANSLQRLLKELEALGATAEADLGDLTPRQTRALGAKARLQPVERRRFMAAVKQVRARPRTAEAQTRAEAISRMASLDRDLAGIVDTLDADDGQEDNVEGGREGSVKDKIAAVFAKNEARTITSLFDQSEPTSNDPVGISAAAITDTCVLAGAPKIRYCRQKKSR